MKRQGSGGGIFQIKEILRIQGSSDCREIESG